MYSIHNLRFLSKEFLPNNMCISAHCTTDIHVNVLSSEQTWYVYRYSTLKCSKNDMQKLGILKILLHYYLNRLISTVRFGVP